MEINQDKSQTSFTEDFAGFEKLLISLIEPSLKSAAARNEGSSDKSSILLGLPAAISLLKMIIVKRNLSSSELFELDWQVLDEQLASSLTELAALSQAQGYEPLGTATILHEGKTPILRDELGFGRDVYLPVILHLNLLAFAYRQEQISQSLWGTCEQSIAQACGMLVEVERFLSEAPPPGKISVSLWSSLVRLEFGLLFSRESDVEAQLGLIDKIVHLSEKDPGTVNADITAPGKLPLTPIPNSSTASHEAPGGGSLDLWTFEELSGLSALSNLAIRLRRQDLAQRVREIACFHVEHTQPDYTTSQPWGVFSFIWEPGFRHFAKQQLFDAQAYGSSQMQGEYDNAGQISPMAALLLTDALSQLAELS